MQDLTRLLRSNIKFKHLHLLVAMNELRHVGKVAEFMHLSQPAISKALAELEAMVETALFERTSRGVVPTAAGELFIRFAQETLGQLDRVGDNFAALRTGAAGSVHIGSMTTATAILLPQAIMRMKERSPTTTVRVDEGLIEDLVERLALGRLDLIIGRLDAIPEPGGLLLEKLYDDAVVVVSAPGHSLASHATLTWADCAAQSWVLPPPMSSARRRFDAATVVHGMERPTDLVESASFLAILTLVRERGSLGILPNALARYCEQAGLLRVLPLPSVHLGSPIGIVRVEDRAEQPATTLFIDCLRAAARRHNPPAYDGRTTPA